MLTPNVTLNGKTILVTGAAGFIGSNLALKLLSTLTGAKIIGVDSVNDYYDVSIKEYRLAVFAQFVNKLAVCKYQTFAYILFRDA
jgi:nucleoside-diphosphate-sugar epimerase